MSALAENVAANEGWVTPGPRFGGRRAVGARFRVAGVGEEEGHLGGWGGHKEVRGWGRRHNAQP